MTEVFDQRAAERRKVASDIKATPESLSALAADSHTGVRSSVGANPTTPTPVLLSLSQDRSEWVRGAVAGNPQAPADLILAMTRDNAWYVRSQAASRLTAGDEAFANLAQDPQMDVVRVVAANPHLTKRAASVIRTGGDPEAIGKLASNPALDDEEVLELLPMLSMWQRQEVAARDPMAYSLLAALAHDEEALVRVVIAKHPRATPDLLAVLAADDDVEVRTAVHRNPNADEQTRATAALLGVQRKESLRD